MTDEYFDVVNERDEPVSRALRSEVHAKGLWHRAVHILVFNREGKVFLQKRSMRKDMSPGLWDSSCSGHVDAGETYDAAAVRELGEELGLAVATTLERWVRVEARDETGWEFCWVYRLEHDGPFTLHPEEIETGQWFAPEEVTRRLAQFPKNYCPAFSYIWNLIGKR